MKSLQFRHQTTMGLNQSPKNKSVFQFLLDISGRFKWGRGHKKSYEGMAGKV